MLEAVATPHRTAQGVSFTLSGLYVRVRPVLFLGPALTVLGVFLLWPLIWVVAMSFTSWDGLGRITWVGLSTWSSVFADPTFQVVIKNTLLWIGLSATIPVILGFALAVVCNRAGPIIGPISRSAVVLPLLLPPAVAAVTWSIVYNPLYGPLDGLLSTFGWPQPDWLGDASIAFWALFVIMLWSCVGFSILVFTAAIRTIDRTYFDLARVEGAGFLRQLGYIVIPACRRSAALAVIVTVVITSQVFDLLSVMTNATNGTGMLPLDMYNKAFGGGNVSQGAAEAAIQVGMGAVLAVVAFGLSGRHPGMSGEGEFQAPRTSRPAIFVAALAAIVFIMPLLWDVMASFTSGASAVLKPLSFTWPLNFSAFATAWNEGIGSGLGQSAEIGVVVVGCTLALSFPAAFTLAGRRMNHTVRGVILGILVLTLLQPGETYLIPLFYLLQQLQLGDTATGLVLAEVARELPFAILLLWLFIGALPADLISAAELEAGRGFHMLSRVVLPMATPISAAIALWVFVTSWSERTLPTILLINSSIVTAPMALHNFASGHDTEFNLLAAGTLLLVLPVVTLLIFAYGPAARGLRTASRMVAG